MHNDLCLQRHCPVLSQSLSGLCWEQNYHQNFSPFPPEQTKYCRCYCGWDWSPQATNIHTIHDPPVSYNVNSTLNAPLSSLFSPHSSLFSDKEDQPALVSLGGPSHQLSIIPTKTAPSNISPLSPGARLGWLLTFYISSHLASKWMAGSLVQRDWSVTL